MYFDGNSFRKRSLLAGASSLSPSGPEKPSTAVAEAPENLWKEWSFILPIELHAYKARGSDAHAC